MIECTKKFIHSPFLPWWWGGEDDVGGHDGVDDGDVGGGGDGVDDGDGDGGGETNDASISIYGISQMFWNTFKGLILLQ